MTGGGGGASPPRASNSGGEFLLQLLQKPHQSQTPAPPPPVNASATPSPLLSLPVDPHHPQNHNHDPAVAAMGPTLPFPPWSSNGHDLHPPWLPNSIHPPYPPNFILRPFPQNPWPLPGFPPPGIDLLDYHRSSHLAGNHQYFGDDLQRLGLLGSLGASGKPGHQQQQQPLQQQQRKLESTMMFGSLACELRSHDDLSNGNSSESQNRRVDGVNIEPQFNVRKDREGVIGSRNSKGSGSHSPDSVNSNRNWQFDRQVNFHGPQHGNYGPDEQGRDGVVWGKQQQTGFQRSIERRTPPGFPHKTKGQGQRSSVSGRRDFDHNVGTEEGSWGKSKHQVLPGYDKYGQMRRQSPEHHGVQGDASPRVGLGRQLDRPSPPWGSNLHSVPALENEESLANLHGEVAKESVMHGHRRHETGYRNETLGMAYVRSGRSEEDVLAEQLIGSLTLKDRFDNNNGARQSKNFRNKEFGSDMFRGLQVPGQRIRNHKREMECRSDIDRLNAPFLAIYESLIPAEEEKAKQKQLLTSLEKLVNKEWPSAQLYLYGSCANSFGVSNSDIDVCLVIEDADISKSEILLKLADILQSDNLQDVQALTRARVPIVKLMDPVTGISCDICINNVLAVVNTKLLRDYAQIDSRLRQLAFLVKHWAKSRGVNETYQGTLSSYAYVLMCIHFLQQRKPAILPCLQGMEATYAVTVDDIECAYFDRVENLSDFGAQNKESIANLIWAFFDYWAYRHDYANTVISVRTGGMISKRAKDWTRRIGNDRHLICIEDPFEISHDLGRVVDKHSIKVLREEFERAADIMQYDPDPCIKLFEPFVPS